MRLPRMGHTVVLSTHVIDHLVLNSDFVDSQKHQIRWMKSTRFSRPKGHFGTSLTFSVPFGLLACVTRRCCCIIPRLDSAFWRIA